MARTVNVRFRSFLPGAGYNSSGAAVQRKTNVRGVVTVTNYIKGGENLTLQDLGLTILDDINLTVVDPVRNTDAVNNLRFARYSAAAQQFYVFEYRQDHTQFYLTGGVRIDVQGIRELPTAASADFTVSFDAFGESAFSDELT